MRFNRTIADINTQRNKHKNSHILFHHVRVCKYDWQRPPASESMIHEASGLRQWLQEESARALTFYVKEWKLISLYHQKNLWYTKDAYQKGCVHKWAFKMSGKSWGGTHKTVYLRSHRGYEDTEESFRIFVFQKQSDSLLNLVFAKDW